MHIGVIETGRPAEELKPRHGDYPAMFRRMLGDIDDAVTFTTYAALDGEVPDDPDAADAWLITGSRHGVYERLEWMERLAAFVREAYARHVPLVGICFGHQIIADALGGEVVKSDRGWGLGVHEYAVGALPDWAGATNFDRSEFRMHAVHQDQVVKLPADAQVLATSEFCPNAMLVYGDRAFTVQPHPEFDTAYMHDLIDVRLAGIIAPDVARDAKATLGDAVDTDWMTQMIGAFLKSALGARKAARSQEREIAG